MKYRTSGGSCNNLKRSSSGMATTPYKRLLFPSYEDGLYSNSNFLILFYIL